MHRFGLILASSLWVVSSTASAGDWNQWRGPNRDGVAPDSPALIDSLPASGIRPVWMTEELIPSAKSGGFGSPVVADGRVYLFTHTRTQTFEGEIPPQKFPWLPPEKRVGMTDKEYEEYEVKRRNEDEERSKLFRFDEVVHAFDAATGKRIWKNERPSVYTRWPQSGSAAVINGKLYALGAGRQMRCLDALTGKDLWTTHLPGEFRDEYLQCSVAVADGAVVVLAGHLFGVDAVSGKILWEGSDEQTRGSQCSPAVWNHQGRELAIINVAGGYTICFEPRTGRELWRVQSEGGDSTPVVVGDRMITYGSSRKKGLRCFTISPEMAEEQWVFQGTQDPASGPVILGDHVFVQGEKRLACVDLATGQASWTATLDMTNPRYASLLAADGKLIYAWEGIFCFEADSSEFRPLINGKIDDTGLLAEESDMRRLLGIDELEKKPGGLDEAQKLWARKVDANGPLVCSTPAFADGKLYVRLKNGLACYDLTAAKDPNAATR